MKRVMFVCTGNVCRSPMAHGYMQKKVHDLKKENDYLISSCGTHAQPGQKATDNAIKSMSKYGVDINNHRATRIEDTDIENYDLILTLTETHKLIIERMYPSLEGKVFTLKEYIDNTQQYINIDDPWGLDVDVYDSTAKEVVENIDKLMEMI